MTTGKLLVNMKTKISLQCPFLLIFYSFLKQGLDILYREGSEMGGPDQDEMFACGRTSLMILSMNLLHYKKYAMVIA